MLILETDFDANSRGLSFNISNMDNWIDVAYRALKDEIRIISLTHEGAEENGYNGMTWAINMIYMEIAYV